MKRMILIAGLAACSKSSRPTTVTDDMVVTADAYVKALDTLGADLEAAGSDCAKATAASATASAAGRTLGPKIAAVKAATLNVPEAKAWLEQNYAAKMKTAFDRVRTAAAVCEHDKEFTAAIENNEILPRKKRSPQER